MAAGVGGEGEGRLFAWLKLDTDAATFARVPFAAGGGADVADLCAAACAAAPRWRHSGDQLALRLVCEPRAGMPTAAEVAAALTKDALPVDAPVAPRS